MRKSEKVTYELDPHNRLVVKPGKESRLAKYRVVLDGVFKTDEHNYLVYHVKKPGFVSYPHEIPEHIKLKGSWSVTENHNLVYTLDKWQNQIYGNRLIFKTGLMDTSENELFFTLTTKGEEKIRTYIIGIEGAWQADRFNRLTFSVSRERGKENFITLKGAWHLNRNNAIIYEYVKEKRAHTIIFKGHWNINEKHYISYYLEKAKDSVFSFRVGKGFSDKAGILQYEIGLGYSRKKRPKMRIITLFGKWKLSEKLGIVFEMDYGEHKVRSIYFGAVIRPKDDYTIEANLKNKKDEPLGIELTLSKTFFKNQARAFITFLKENRELSVTAGAGFLF